MRIRQICEKCSHFKTTSRGCYCNIGVIRWIEIAPQGHDIEKTKTEAEVCTDSEFCISFSLRDIPDNCPFQDVHKSIVEKTLPTE